MILKQKNNQFHGSIVFLYKTMSSISSSKFICNQSLHRNLISLNFLLSPSSLSFHLCPHHSQLRHCPAAIKTGAEGRGGSDLGGAHLLRKPVISPMIESLSTVEESADEDEKTNDGNGHAWVDWEDHIVEDTVPLVGFARMILHSGKYKIGDRLSPEHERTILERLLPYHPQSEKKTGTGVDYITIGYHLNFEGSQYLFIVRKDGELVDFSYWKCIKGLIRKNYPLYADSFILRHFRKCRRD